VKNLTAEEILMEYLTGKTGRNLTERDAILKAMYQFADQEVKAAIEKRDEEIEEWIEKKMPNQEVMKALRSELLLGKTELLEELKQFLSQNKITKP